MNKKQSLAIVGCGGITDHYVNVYRELDFTEVAVCVDAELARAENYASIFRADAARASIDFADALAPDVDTVIINAPNHLHLEQTVAALDADKHVLLQKPVAANLEDAEAIAEAAERAARRGVLSGLYMSYFDQPLMHDLRQMVQAGWFGEIAHLYGRLMHRGGMDWSRRALGGEKTWRGSVVQTGGGCFIQLAVHYIHLFEWMTGARFVRAQAATANLHSGGLEGEDIACAILEFDTGALATLDMAWCASGEQLSIHGTRGTAEYVGNRHLFLNGESDWRGRVVDYRAARKNEVSDQPGGLLGAQKSEIIAPPLGDISNELNQQKCFLEAVQNNRQPFVSIASGVEDMRVVAAVYEAARRNCTVEIKRHDQPQKAVVIAQQTAKQVQI